MSSEEMAELSDRVYQHISNAGDDRAQIDYWAKHYDKIWRMAFGHWRPVNVHS